MDKRTRCQQILQRFKTHHPAPRTELIYHTPFELLVAVMLSAQTTDHKVNEVTATLFKTANTPEGMLTLGEIPLQRMIKSVNYYLTKAKHLIQTSQRLIQYHQGQLPSTRHELEALPGVGRKTANVLLSILFNQPTLAVDTHVFRVARRLGLSTGRTPLAVEQDLLQLIETQDVAAAHHWFILHGRYVCVARRPHCHGCLLADLCPEYGAS